MDNNKILISELDFDKIKSNLKTFLSGQSQFSDYNFEGSALSTLMDILSYNTHYNGFYSNMLVNEMFIDTAVKRSSVLSRAKELGYTPRSATAAIAVISVKVLTTLADTNQTLTIPRGTIFEGSAGGTAKLNFVTIKSYLATKTYDSTIGSYVFNFPEIQVYEGTPISNTFIYDSVKNPNAIFEFLNKDIDTKTLKVTVKESLSSLTDNIFEYSKDIYNISATSNIYFIQENYNGNFEIQFGDGNIGKALTSGNVITTEYLVTNKENGNSISVFSLPSNIGTYTTFIISTVSPSSGGQDKEATDLIRFNAPKSWAAQNRAVTDQDYRTLLTNEIPNVESVKVWGGEDNEPPIYGKVFLSVKPTVGFTFTEVMKQNYIKNLIKNHNVVTIIPEFVDPIYLYVSVNTEIKYDSHKLGISEDSLRSLVITQINNYFDTSLQKFDNDFYYSKFVRLIDDIDSSIISNFTQVKVQRRIDMIENAIQTVDFSFINTIVPGTITSTYFNILLNSINYSVKISDTLTNISTNTGVISLVNTTNGNILVDNAGVVNYTTGKMTINPFYLVSTNDADKQIRFHGEVEGNDISSKMNYIITVDNSSANATVGQDSGLIVKLTGI